MDIYTFTELLAEEEGPRDAILWAAGQCDFWLNGAHAARFTSPRYYPTYRELSLALKPGRNILCSRLQTVGMRDTRLLIGLQVTNPQGISIRIPGGDALPAAVFWLNSLHTKGANEILAARPAPLEAAVTWEDKEGGLSSLLVPPSLHGGEPAPGEASAPWPPGTSRFSFGSKRPYDFTVSINADGQHLIRSLEIPANRPSAISPRLSPASPGERRLAFLEAIASVPFDEKNHHSQHQLPLIARRLLKKSAPHDRRGLDLCIEVVDHREDCADFRLAGLLRLEKLALTTPEESAEIRRAALTFRYWHDEPGNDAMCFGSENHSLLFHGSQMMAGQLYPDEIFTCTGRTGREQAAIGLAHVKEWLDRICALGLSEFHSGTYQPITLGAIMNVIDFCGDKETERRATQVADRVLEMNAAHVFKGVVSAPQGRVYRDVLYPEESGTQSIMACVAPGLLMDAPHVNEWMVYLCTTKYQAPKNLEELFHKTAALRYRAGMEGEFEEAGAVEIAMEKTEHYLLSSIAVPPVKNPSPFSTKVFFPGHIGYQQHLWQATLDRGCHVFVNHPGCSMDEAGSRPGYWYGNGIIPRVAQKGGKIFTIFNIPDRPCPWNENGDNPWPSPGGESACERNPIPFTHAFWPSDAFDREERRAHWLFGQKGSGAIALWCSLPLTPHNDVLSGREFRAWGYRSAWFAVCGTAGDEKTFAQFIGSCAGLAPTFDPDKLVLRVRGESDFRLADGFSK